MIDFLFSGELDLFMFARVMVSFLVRILFESFTAVKFGSCNYNYTITQILV